MFPGFTDEDYDAYAPAKWSSNVYTRTRLEVKQKLLALGRELSGTLLGRDLAPLACDASVEYPALWNQKRVDAQHLFFWRNPEARRELDAIIDRGRTIASMLEDPSPQRSHLFLSVSIDHDRVEIGLKLHSDARVDRENLVRKCEDFFAREKLVDLIRALSAGWQVGLVGHEGNRDLITTEECDDPALQRILATFGDAGSLSLLVGRAFPRADAAPRSPDFVQVAHRCLAEVLPIYQFIAWTRDNDYVSMRETLAREKQTRVARGLAKNDRVRIVRGLFAGKVGVVQDADAKGGLKLLVGKMAVRVEAGDVVKAS